MASWWPERFPPSRPRQVRGGIRSQARAGTGSWWAKRFIQVLESIPMGGRLERGRRYARIGQVISIAIEKGQVGARVQGSRPKPYDVVIKLRTLPEREWREVAAALSARTILAAKLVSGEMPEELEALFAEAHAPLFPARHTDLATQCSCPDAANPCKHIAAVYYLLAEELDRDPFLLLKLRGKERGELMALMGPSPMKAREAATKAAEPEAQIRAELPRYWQGKDLPLDLFGKVEITQPPAALVARLGNFPFWRAEQTLLVSLQPTYAQAAQHGLDLFLRATAPTSPALNRGNQAE